MKKTFSFFVSFLVVSVLFFFIGFYSGSHWIAKAPVTPPIENETSKTTDSEKKESKIDFIFDFGDGQRKEFSDILIEEGDTVFDLLKKISAENNLNLKYQDSSLGAFIEEINGYKNDLSRGYFWQYWANGEYAKVGAGSYVLQPGDKIEWRYSNEKIK